MNSGNNSKLKQTKIVHGVEWHPTFLVASGNDERQEGAFSSLRVDTANRIWIRTQNQYQRRAPLALPETNGPHTGCEIIPFETGVDPDWVVFANSAEFSPSRRQVSQTSAC